MSADTAPAGAPGRTIRPADRDRPTLTSAELFGSARELEIRHGDELYRLRLTGSNKLILTK